MSKSEKRRPEQGAKPSAPAAAPAWRTKPWLLTLATFVIVSIAVWIVYGRAIDSPFIFDDSISVVNNPSIVRLFPLVGDAENPGPLNPAANLSTSGRPLVNLSLAMNYKFDTLNPRYYHVFNIILHILSATLLGAIVFRTLQLSYFNGKFDGVAWPLSVITALLWALHPLQTEAVIYVTQRTELMMGFFYLAVVYSSLRYWAAESSAGRTTWIILSSLACLCGMASKEVMVSAPLVVLLYDRAFISGSFRGALQRSWPLYAGLSLGWLLLLALNISSPRGESAGFHHDVVAYVWWFTQCKVLLMYLKLCVWPWPLVIHYGTPYLDTVPAALPFVLPVLLMAIGTLYLLWKNRPSGFLLAAVWLVLAPTFIVPIVTEVAAERRMYLPLASLVSLLVVGGYLLAQWAGQYLAERPANRRMPAAMILLALGLIAAWSLVSTGQLSAYQDELKLWQTNVNYEPEDALAHYNLCNGLAKQKDSSRAIEHYESALRIRPNYSDAHFNLANALIKVGNLPDAISHYAEVVRIEPKSADAQYNLASALSQANRQDEALDHYREAVRIRPDLVDGQNALGVLLMERGELLEAVNHFQEAVQHRPGFTQARVNMVSAYVRMNRASDAVAAAEQALKMAQGNNETAVVEKLEPWLATYRTAQSSSALSSAVLPPAITANATPAH